MSRTSWKPQRMLGSAALACALVITSAVPALGAVPSSSAASAAVTSSIPVTGTEADQSGPQLSVPRVTGTARVGQLLTADVSAPEGSVLQWSRDGHPIPGATGHAYELRLDDACTYVTVRVTPPARTGEQPRTSEPIGPVQLTASHVSTPQVTGTAAVGKVLRAAPGTWPAGTTLSYQWLRGGKPINAATASTYTLTRYDLGQQVTVRITGSVNGCALPTATSPVPSAVPVAAGTLVAPAPSVQGTAKVGHRLTAMVGAWTPGTTLRYQWYRQGVAITGATAKTYTAGASDRGKALTVKVTGSKDGYARKTVTSAKTRAVAAGTLTAPTPKLTSAPKVGQKLTVSVGTWSAGTTLKYQWYRNGSGIKGATAKSYTATASDRGKALAVKVTGSRTGYATKSVTSAKSRAVAAGTLKTAVPKVSGTAKAGKKLTVSRGSWTTGTKLTQRWYRNGAVISGATGTAYTLKSADAGRTITVKVTGSKVGYTTVTRASAGVRVQAAPKPVAKPKPVSTRTAPRGTSCPSTHPIKGNADSGIYHVPTGSYYSRTTPEECFKSESAARAAGYRKSKR